MAPSPPPNRSSEPCVHYASVYPGFQGNCPNDNDCAHCRFDEFLDQVARRQAAARPLALFDVHGVKIPCRYYLHRGHTWVCRESRFEASIGIDDFASRLLGPLDRIETPSAGEWIRQGRSDIRIVRGRRSAGLISPVTGVITAINPVLARTGRLANPGAYPSGWILRVHANTLGKDLRRLIRGRALPYCLDRDIARLYRDIEKVAGPLATDGGQLGKDIFGKLPELGWGYLTSQYLGSP